MLSRQSPGRVFLLAAAGTFFLLAPAAWYVDHRLGQAGVDPVRQRLSEIATRALPWAVESLSNAGGSAPIPPPAAWRDARLELLDAEGGVVWSSPPPSTRETPDPAVSRERGASARYGKPWSSEAILHLGFDVEGADGARLGRLRVAAPVGAISGSGSRVRFALLSLVLLAAVIGGAAAFLVARAAARRPGPREGRNPRDARKRAMTEQHLEMEAILGSMNEGVVAVDQDQRVLLMNASAARLLGLSEPLDRGADIWNVVRFPELKAALSGVLAGQGSFLGDAPSPRMDGCVLSLSASAIRPGRGAVAILSDVTSIRRLEQVRIDFVANVSHEMRTPLAAVLGAIETMQDPSVSREDAQRFLDLARRNAERMRNIVADLLELSHIETERDKTELSRTNLELPVRASAGALAGEAEAQGVDLVVEPSPESPLDIMGSDKRLEQIFTNLIENAIKYTPRGGTVRVRFVPSPREVAVEVEDTGMGIPKDALPRVFERFYRVDKARSRELGGTGLGLAIVKHATRMHGGRVEVSSEEGRGTTFRVVLPRVAPRR